MRGHGQRGAVVWVFDERRRVRDDVAGRLLALPFVGRVEAVGDAASLMTRLANRLPDVLLVGTQRATDSGLSVATQVLRAHPAVPVLVLGAPDDAETVRAAVAFGARGYLRWDASPLELGLGLSRIGLRPEAGRPQLAPPPRSPQHAVAMAGGAVPGPAPGAVPARWPAPRPTTVRSTVPETPQVAPVDARDAGADRDEPGQEQRPDRPGALPVRGHHQDPRPAAVPQARRQGPRRGGRHRLPPRHR